MADLLTKQGVRRSSDFIAQMWTSQCVSVPWQSVRWSPFCLVISICFWGSYPLSSWFSLARLPPLFPWCSFCIFWAMKKRKNSNLMYSFCYNHIVIRICCLFHYPAWLQGGQDDSSSSSFLKSKCNPRKYKL